MVLEEATNSSSDSPFVPEASPSSDIDPYSASSSTDDVLHLNISNYPQPMPIFGPLVGHTKTRLAGLVNRGIVGASLLLKRPPTQEEANALAYYICRGESTISYGQALGFGFGTYLWHKGREKHRFPFFTPDRGWFNPYKFGPLKGQLARVIWQSIRFNIYALSGFYLGGLVARSASSAYFAFAVQRDERMKELRTAMIEFAQRRRERRRNTQPQPVAKSKQENWHDDMSPQAGSYPQTDTAVLSESQRRTQEGRQRPYSRWDSTDSSESSFGEDKVTPQTRSFGQDYDDASPTTNPMPESSRSGGSAWDRLRRQAREGKSQSSQPASNRFASDSRGAEREQRDRSMSGDSFAFSTTEEDRQLARAEAQKEFDARVERERQGKDFNDSGRKW
jgi:hypothetical protein